MTKIRVLLILMAVILGCVACKMTPAKDENYLTSSAGIFMIGDMYV